MKLDKLIPLCHSQVDQIYQHYLVDARCADLKLQQTMVYAVQNGGKKIRPLLVYAVGSMFTQEIAKLAAPSAAIELIHTYSLIHDDLPAMDDSDLRRGKPSCHKAFNEALAILAGDALQPLAFQIIADHPGSLSSEQRLGIISVLTEASGLNGMAAGQSMDLSGVNTQETLDLMYRLKTGALIIACVKIGLIACDVRDLQITQALTTYIENIGFAFQIQDDLLDILGDSALTGKPIGLDDTNKKLTYPALMGVAESKVKIQNLFGEALAALDYLGNNAEILREVAYYLLHRNQ